MPENCKTLSELWEYTMELNRKHFPENNLMPIYGNGKTFKPKIMFVFINPTARNISSRKEWKGPRFPFIGTKEIWRIFHKAGMFDEKLMIEINARKIWPIGFTNKVLSFLKKNNLYITNLVKWTGANYELPELPKKAKLFLPILKREIELVKPEYIVTFGLPPFTYLTGRKIRLRDYYEEFIQSGKLTPYKINNVDSKVIPCYFPTGRGNPKRAIEILKAAAKL